MAQEFLPNSDDSNRPNDGCAVAEQEILRVAVTGSRDGVLQTISTLHQLGFAKIGDWSRLQRGARPGEVVSVLYRPPAFAKTYTKSGRVIIFVCRDIGWRDRTFR